MPGFLNDLALSDAQQAEVKALLKNQRSGQEDKHEAAIKIHKEIKSLSFSDDYTDDKALAIVEKANALRKDEDLKKSRLDNAIYKSLTSEQKQKIKTRLTQSENCPF